MFLHRNENQIFKKPTFDFARSVFVHDLGQFGIQDL